VERIDWRLADGTAWLERLMGLSLAQVAAGISPDDPRPTSFWQRSEAQRELYRAWSESKNRLGRWPSPPNGASGLRTRGALQRISWPPSARGRPDPRGTASEMRSCRCARQAAAPRRGCGRARVRGE